ncbi:MAG: hypothetical protein JOZ03_10280 [Gammaproteobacteria bacterium]|nr:hypothetical protein [Gammaproteobacteria bacterium]
MNQRSTGGALRVLPWLLALALSAGASAALAQTSPLTIQSLFFNTGSGVHRGNFLELDGGLIYNDNVDLTRNGSSDVLALLGLVGNISRLDAPRLDYHINSDIALVKYLRSSFQTQPFGYLDAAGEFKIVPGTLSWTARDSYSQAILNPAVPPTPDNLESLNFFTTGPRLILRPTLRTTITVDGTYSYLLTGSKSSQYINIDHHRYGADARIERAFSSTFSAYVQGNYDKVEFKDLLINRNFVAEQGLAGVKFGDARTFFDAQGGYTRLHLGAGGYNQFQVGPNTPSGVNYRLTLSRLIAPNQRLSLYTYRQVTDAANLFRINLDQPVPSNGQNQILTGEPFTHREYGATYHIEGPRTVLEVNGIIFTDRYTIVPANNRDVHAATAFLSRQLNLSWSLELGGSLEQDKYFSGATLHTLNLLASLRWRVGPRVGLRFVLGRTSYTPYGYPDTQVGVIASYALTAAALTPDGLVTPTPLLPTSPATQPLIY